MKRKITTSVLVFIHFIAAYCQPTNDNCSNAIQLFPATTKNWTAASVTNATNSLPSLKSTCDNPIYSDVWFYFFTPNDMDFTQPFFVYTENISLSTPGTTGRNIYDLGCDVYENCSGTPVFCIADDDLPDPNQVTYMPNAGRLLSSSYKGKKLYIRLTDIGRKTSGNFKIALVYTKTTGGGGTGGGSTGGGGTSSFSFAINPTEQIINNNETIANFKIITNDPNCTWSALGIKTIGYMSATLFPSAGKGSNIFTIKVMNNNVETTDNVFYFEFTDCKGNKYPLKLTQKGAPKKRIKTFIEDFCFYSDFANNASYGTKLNGDIKAINWKAFGTKKSDVPEDVTSGTILTFPDGIIINNFLKTAEVGTGNFGKIYVEEVNGQRYILKGSELQSWTYYIANNTLTLASNQFVNYSLSLFGFQSKLTSAELTQYKPDHSNAGIIYDGNFNIKDFNKVIKNKYMIPYSFEISSWSYQRANKPCPNIRANLPTLFGYGLFESDLSIFFNCATNSISGSGSLKLKIGPLKNMPALGSRFLASENKLKEFSFDITAAGQGKGIPLSLGLEFYKVHLFVHNYEHEKYAEIGGYVRPRLAQPLVQMEKLLEISGNAKWYFSPKFSTGGNTKLLNLTVSNINMEFEAAKARASLNFNFNKRASFGGSLLCAETIGLGGHWNFETRLVSGSGKGYVYISTTEAKARGAAYIKKGNAYGYCDLIYRPLQNDKLDLNFDAGYCTSIPQKIIEIDEQYNKLFAYNSNSHFPMFYQNLEIAYAMHGPIPSIIQWEKYEADIENKKRIFNIVGGTNQSRIFIYCPSTKNELELELKHLDSGSLMKITAKKVYSNIYELYLYKPKLGTFLLTSTDNLDSISIANFYEIPQLYIKSAQVKNDKILFELQSNLNVKEGYISLYLSPDSNDYSMGYILADSLNILRNTIDLPFNVSPGKYWLHAHVHTEKLTNFSRYSKPLLIENTVAKIADFAISQVGDSLSVNFIADTVNIEKNAYVLYASENSENLLHSPRQMNLGAVSSSNKIYAPELIPLGRKWHFQLAHFVGDSLKAISNIEQLNYFSKAKKNTPFYYGPTKFRIEKNKLWSYKLNIKDLDNDIVSYSIIKADAKFKINDGLASYTPGLDDDVFQEVVLEITDGENKEQVRFYIELFDSTNNVAFLDFDKPVYNSIDETAIAFVTDPLVNSNQIEARVYSSSNKNIIKKIALSRTGKDEFSTSFSLKELVYKLVDTLFLEYTNSKGIKTIDFAHMIKGKTEFKFADSICAGSKIDLFNVSVIANVNKIEWRINNKLVSTNYHAMQLELPRIYGSGIKILEIELVITDELGKIFSSKKVLHVFPLPKTKMDSFAGCIGKENVFEPAFLSNGIESVHWLSEKLDVNVNENKFILKAQAGFSTINYVVADLLGCKNADTIVIQGVTKPSAHIAGNLTACENKPIVLWGNSYSFEGVKIENYWQGQKFVNDTFRTAYKSYGQKPIVYIARTAQGCEDTLQITATINPNPIAKIEIDNTEKCENETFVFRNVSNPVLGEIGYSEFKVEGKTILDTVFSYNFKNWGLKSISLLTRNYLGCEARTTANVPVHSKPNVKIIHSRNDSCAASNLSLFKAVTSNPDGKNIVKYTWENKENEAITKRHFQSVGSHTVKVKITTEGGCKDSSKYSVQVYPQGSANFKVNPNPVCFNQTSKFENTSAGANYKKHEWNIESRDFEGTSVDYKFKQPGEFAVILGSTTIYGCYSEKRDTAIVYALPKAIFQYNQIDTVFSDYTSSLFYFDASKSSSDVVKYEWDLGNVNSQGPKISHRFKDSMHKPVTLKVLNYNGCIDTAFVLIKPQPKFSLFIPTGFSPNGDGLNDAFSTIGTFYYRDYSMKIYNRWGQKVFESNDILKKWDGALAPEGVYTYLVTFQELNYKRHYKRGVVTLLR